MALDFTTNFTTSLIKLNNQYTIVGNVADVDVTIVPKKGELYFMPETDGERTCKIGDGNTQLQHLPVIGVSSLNISSTTEDAKINLAYSNNYKLNVGGKSIVFKMPDAVDINKFTDTYQKAKYNSGIQISTGQNGINSLYVPTGTSSNTVALGNHTHNITASATDGIFNLTGTAGTNSVTYKVEPYASTTATKTWINTSTNTGKFYLGSNANPSQTTRLNWNGYLYATKFAGPLEGNASSASHLKFIKKLDTADNLDTLTTPGLYWWGNGTSAPTANGTKTLPFTNASVVEVSPIINPEDGTQYGVTQKMWRYGASGYVAQRTIYGDNVLDWFTFETKDHSHDVSIATSTATNDITLSHGSKYALTVGGQSFVFTMPSGSHTITANATDGMFNLTGTNGTNAVTYAVAPYSSTTATSSWIGTAANAGKFYSGSNANPSKTTRLNYNGYLYATKLYSGGVEVSTTDTKVEGVSTTTSSEYPIFFKNSTGSTTTAAKARFNTGFTFNPGSSSAASSLKVTSGGSSVQLDLSRASGCSYIINSGEGQIGICAGRATAKLENSVVFTGSAVYPGTNSGKTGEQTLGTVNNKWRSVYATQFYGSGSHLTNLDASNFASGTLSVTRGGTGATSQNELSEKVFTGLYNSAIVSTDLTKDVPLSSLVTTQYTTLTTTIKAIVLGATDKPTDSAGVLTFNGVTIANGTDGKCTVHFKVKRTSSSSPISDTTIVLPIISIPLK